MSPKRVYAGEPDHVFNPDPDSLFHPETQRDSVIPLDFGSLEHPAPDSTNSDTSGVSGAPAGLLKFQADEVTYLAGREVILTGAAVVENEGMTLEADSISFDTDEESITATGQPLLLNLGDRVSGSLMEFDINTGQGKVTDGITLFENGLYRGETIRSFENESYRIAAGRFSTCRRRHPHYYFKSSEISVEKDNKAVARPVVFYVADMPAFYLPYFIFSLAKGRHSGILTPRYNDDSVSGRFIRNLGYYFAPSEYWDLTAKADIYESGKYRFQTDLDYAVRYLIPTGSLSMTYESGPDWGNEDFSTRFNQSYIPFPDASLSLNGSYSTRNRFTGTDWSLDRNVTGSFSWSWRTGDRYTFRASGSYSGDLVEGNGTETFPTLSLSRSWQEFLEAPEDPEVDIPLLSKLGFTWSANFNRYFSDSYGSTRRYKYINQNLTLSGRGIETAAGALNITPSITFMELWSRNRYSYTEGETTGDLEWGVFARHTWTSQLRLKSSARGLYTPGWGPLEAVLHAVDPSLTAYYTPFFEQYFDHDSTLDRDMDVFSGISSTPRERKQLSYSLSNGLKAKWRTGDGSIDKINFLTFTISGSYDFLRDYKSELPGSQHFSDLNTSARLEPLDNGSISLSCPFDPYDKERGTFSATLKYRYRSSGETGETEETLDSNLFDSGLEIESMEGRSDPFAYFYESDLAEIKPKSWNINGTYQFSRTTLGVNSSRASGSINFSPSENWALGINLNYDITNLDLTSTSLRVTRDMHCWEGSLDYRLSGTVWSYYFVVRIKELPDIKIERTQYGS